MIRELGAQLHLEVLKHGQQQMPELHVELIEVIQMVKRHAVDEFLRVVRFSQVLAVCGQAVIIDCGEDAARAVGVFDSQVMYFRQAAGLLFVAARRFNGGVDAL